MSPGSPRDLSGLLYLPGEELVRSTIDGDDADWSESLSYVPPDSLVRTVLDASPRERPVFLIPATLVPQHAPLGARSRARRTAALLAGLGLSPFSLAAAAVLHVAFLFAVGPWIVTQASAARSIRAAPPPPVVAMRLVYPSPAKPVSPPIGTARARPRRGNIRQATDTSNTDAVRTVLPMQRDTSGGGESRSRASVEREVETALRQELFFAGDGFDLEPRDSLKLRLIVRVLTTWPEYRLRVLGAAPRRREPGAIPGMAEAEWVKRALVQAGIDSERIEIGQVPEAERVCPEREPLCVAGRRHVRTMVARP